MSRGPGREAFKTLNAAMRLTERHPDAPSSVVLVGLVLAKYANGDTGARIFPGTAALVTITGLNRRTVQLAVKWLMDHGELRRDREGRSARGNRPPQAAEYTWIGGMDGPAPAAPKPTGRLCECGAPVAVRHGVELGACDACWPDPYA